MKVSSLVLMALLAAAGASGGEVGPDQLESLTARLGDKFWSAPEKRLVRATTYKKGRGADDPHSARGRSDERIGLRLATAKEAGTLAAPDWLPRGSLVKIHTEEGVLAYVAADRGSAVEACTAARESGRTAEQKAAPVLDFCANRQLWPDFVIVDIYYYNGRVPFSDLGREEQEALFAYAMKYVREHE